VDLFGIVQALNDSTLSDWLRSSLKAMPTVEAIHVMAIAVVVGTIFIVDLRLLGYPSTQREFSRLHRELLQWTWWAFVLSVITGVLLFMVNAVTYYRNTAFWLKMALILLAGINMLVFERVTAKSVASWDKGVLPPSPARADGGLSLVFWIPTLFVARWIGFTKGYDFTIPEDVQFDFSGL
jgi:uncharacterized membrane protein